MYSLEFYRTQNGKVPIEEFIDEQDERTKKNI